MAHKAIAAATREAHSSPPLRLPLVKAGGSPDCKFEQQLLRSSLRAFLGRLEALFGRFPAVLACLWALLGGIGQDWRHLETLGRPKKGTTRQEWEAPPLWACVRTRSCAQNEWLHMGRCRWASVDNILVKALGSLRSWTTS